MNGSKMKILVIKLGALGDVINTLPLIVNIKKRLECEIHWLVEPLSLPLLKSHRCVDKTWVFDKRDPLKSFARVAGQIRRVKYDITLDLQRILKSALLTLLVKSRRKICFDRNRCKEFTWLLPFERLAPFKGQKHMLDHYLDFLSPLHIDKLDVEWQIPRFSKETLLPLNLRYGSYVVLNIGATKPANLWPRRHFAVLSDKIADRLGFQCVLTGGKEDAGAAEEIMAHTVYPVINLTGKTSLEVLIEVLAGAACVVTGDTGPMHLACALKRDVVALFGPSNPQRTGPYRGSVIQKPIHCGPCNRRHCPDPSCMEAITPSDVMEALAPKLKIQTENPSDQTTLFSSMQR